LKEEDIKVAIVIPVYNHSRTLREIVTRALQVHDKVLVVDDGSTDGDADTLPELHACIMRHPMNLGKGAAILTAAREAGRAGITHIVTIDADGQHDPRDFQRFLPVIRQSPYAIVIGRRVFESANVPGASRFGRKFSNFWFRVQTGKSLGDTQSGFRAYPVVVLDKLKLREPRYAFEVEVLVKAAWAGVEFREVDVSVYYPPEEDRISHFRGFIDNFRISLLNFKLTMRSIAPFPHRKIVFDKQTSEIITVLHPVRSLKTLLTENTSPQKLAAAGALGVFLGALPLIACHTVTILFVAGFFRLNRIVAVSTSQLCMPPLVPALCIETGYFLRHGEFLTVISLETLGYQGLERVYEWLIGSLIFGPSVGIFIGGLIYVAAVLLDRGGRARI